MIKSKALCIHRYNINQTHFQLEPIQSNDKIHQLKYNQSLERTILTWCSVFFNSAWIVICSNYISRLCYLQFSRLAQYFSTKVKHWYYVQYPNRNQLLSAYPLIRTHCLLCYNSKESSIIRTLDAQYKRGPSPPGNIQFQWKCTWYNLTFYLFTTKLFK